MQPMLCVPPPLTVRQSNRRPPFTDVLPYIYLEGCKQWVPRTSPPPPTARSAPTTVNPPVVASGWPDMAQAATLTSSMALPLSAHRIYQRAWTPDTASASDSNCP
ncbi:unnamed protein product [Malus baccata var. baccata]